MNELEKENARLRARVAELEELLCELADEAVELDDALSKEWEDPSKSMSKYEGPRMAKPMPCANSDWAGLTDEEIFAIKFSNQRATGTMEGPEEGPPQGASGA